MKAVGHGLGIALQRVEFHPQTMVVKEDAIVTDTQLFFDGKLLASWCFEETKLDQSHFVAVAVNQENQVCLRIYMIVTCSGETEQVACDYCLILHLVHIYSAGYLWSVIIT